MRNQSDVKTDSESTGGRVSLRIHLIIIAAAAFALLQTSAQAQVIYQHLGQNDPVVDEGWTLITEGAGGNVSPGNDGVDYWDISCPYSGSIYYHVTLPASDYTDPSGWTATLNLEVLKADANANTLRASISAADGNGNSWAITVGGGPGESAGNSGVFYLDSTGNTVRIPTSIDPTSGYHHYQIVYPGSGGTGTADFLIDGTLAVTLNRSQVDGGGTGTDSGLYFGGFGTGASTSDNSDAHYAAVVLETGQHPYVPPSTILSQSPAPNAVNVSPSTGITVTLLDGSTPVLTNDIQLSLNNVLVTPTISKPTNVTTITYQPPGNLALSSTNTITLVFNDTASTLATNSWTFTVANQFVIAEHIGAADPTTEGFSLYNNGGNLAGGNDGVSNFWDISSPSGGNAYYTAALTASDFADPTGWTVTATEQVVRANNSNGGNNNNFVAVVDGTNAWLMILEGGSGIAPSSYGLYADDENVNLLQLSSRVDPTAFYRTYQMVYNPTNQTVAYYVDGYFITTLTRSQVFPLSGDGEFLQWGDGTSFSPGEDTKYSLVELQAGQHPLSPVAFTNAILSQSPAVNGNNVSPTAAINITLDGSGPLLTNDVQLIVNGSAVTPTITPGTNNNLPPASVLATISYTPPVNWVLNSVNTLTLIFNNTAGTLVTNTWSFTVASQFVIAEHVGQNDPTTEGFSVYLNGENVAGGNDGVSNFWELSSGTGGSGYYTAALTSSDLSDPSGWTLTASEKVIRAYNENGGNNNNFVAVVDGTTAWLVILGGGPSVPTPAQGLFVDDENVNLLQLSSAAQPASGYRTYQMVYNPTNQTVSYYVDGYFITTLTRSQVFPLSGDGEFLQFGDGTSFSPGEDTRYALIELQAGQHPIAPAFFPNTIQSQSPGPNAVNVAPNAPVTILLDSGSGQINTNQVQLIVNGSPVTATMATVATNNNTIPAAVVTSVSYTPPSNWALNSSNTLTLVFNDSASTLVTNTWTFTVASQFVYAEHIGLNNPTTEGFTLCAGSESLTGGNDGVSNFWEISGSSGVAYYTANLAPADFADPSGWTLTASELVIRDNNGNGGNNNNFVAAVDGTNAWLIILEGGSGIPASSYGLYTDDPNINLLQLSAAIDPTSGYHTYQIVFNPGTQAASFYVDGYFVTTLTRSQVFPLSGDGDFLQFGDGTSFSPSDDTRYALVELQAGQHPISPQPSPAIGVAAAGSNLNFSWSGTGFVLQTNGNLSNPSGWANVPGGNSSPVTVPVGPGDLFFRLQLQNP